MASTSSGRCILVACCVLAASCRSPRPGADASTTTDAAEAARLHAIPRARLCVSSGRVDTLSSGLVRVDEGGMRAVAAGGTSSMAELAFTYRGPSTAHARLANGELRRQIGLKLRARDTCNVIYVMWHVQPTTGIFVSVKNNPGSASHGECGAGGYINVRPRAGGLAPRIVSGERHTLRAELQGDALLVFADGAPVWQGALPPQALTFDGPSGVRSDNGVFEFELRVPMLEQRGADCSSPK